MYPYLRLSMWRWGCGGYQEGDRAHNIGVKTDTRGEGGRDQRPEDLGEKWVWSWGSGGLGDSDNQYHHGQGYIGIHNLSLVSEDTRVWSCVTSGMSGTSHDSCVVGDLQRWMREIDHPHPRPILYFPMTLALTVTCPRPDDDKVTRCANDRGHLDWPWPSWCDYWPVTITLHTLWSVIKCRGRAMTGSGSRIIPSTCLSLSRVTPASSHQRSHHIINY